MSLAHDLFSNIWRENQEESTSEKRQTNEKRGHEEWNALRPEDASLQAPSAFYPVPSFSVTEVEKEAFLIKVIHTILTDFPRYFIKNPKEHFTREINEYFSKYPKVFSGKAPFERSDDCVEFIQRRRFLFEKRPQDKHHRNTGFEHRKTVGKIVRFVQKTMSSIGRCPLEYLIDFCKREIGRRNDCSVKSIPTEEFVGGFVHCVQRKTYSSTRCSQKDLVELEKKKRWAEPLNEYPHMKTISIREAVRKLVDGYPELFWTETKLSEVFVGLQQLTFDIPSLWIENVLMEDPTKPYFDKSRTEVFLAEISCSRYGYKGKIMEARILDGRCENHVIHIFEEYPTDPSKILINTAGTRVIVYAHLVLCCSYQFFGIKVVPVPRGRFDPIDRRILEMVARGDLDVKEASALPSTPDLPTNCHVQYAPLTELIAAEELVIEFVDKIFGEKRLTIDRFVQKLQDKSDGSDYEHFFLHPGAAVDFVIHYPHLYCFNEGGAGEAWALSQAERRRTNKKGICPVFVAPQNRHKGFKVDPPLLPEGSFGQDEADPSPRLP